MAFPYCSKCKGTRDLCGLGRCPLLERIRERFRSMQAIGDTVEGPSPPSVFVGSYGHPRVTIGPLTTPADIPLPERLESGTFLFTRSIEDVYSIRTSMVRGKYRLDVRTSRDARTLGSEPLFEVEGKMAVRGRKILDSVQEIALSARSLDTEMKVTGYGEKGIEPPSFDSISMPMGPSVNVTRVKVIDDPKVPGPIERITSDTDVNATEASVELFKSGIPVEHLVRLFSVGLLGQGKRRRLVPTRWTITAIDDILSRELKEEVTGFDGLDRYLLFSSQRFGNHFLVALYPPPFRFEMLEQWQNDSLWGQSPVTTDHEGPRGRKDYADGITGAYYAARLSVLNYLKLIRRNAGFTVIRWITGDYWAPLGVWVIRETVRNALGSEPLVFERMGQMMEKVNELSGMKNWKAHARYLTDRRLTTLDEFSS
ncbi:MAG: hypothetical protein JXA22_09260 [Candidatus Thermoplasmatota archaeon]|nr:hypothetical protein [Candidatus Thermoplasmatota archaeon]